MAFFGLKAGFNIARIYEAGPLVASLVATGTILFGVLLVNWVVSATEPPLDKS